MLWKPRMVAACIICAGLSCGLRICSGPPLHTAPVPKGRPASVTLTALTILSPREQSEAHGRPTKF